MLPSLLLCVALHAGATTLRSPQPADSSDVFRFVRLADGVHAAEVLPAPAAYAFANSLIVIGREGVLIVDTQQSTMAARSVIEEVRRLTPLPVRWVVNTHWHGDHVHGNVAYREAFPQVSFIGHRSLPADLDSLTRARLRRDLAQVPASIVERERWLATGTGPDGTALGADERVAVERSIRLRSDYLEDLRRLSLVAPDRTFERRLDIDVGGRVVRLLHFGPAHTQGDVVVLLPAERILMASDLVEEELPYLGDGEPGGWAAVVDSLDALDFDILVPSHGSVQHDRALLGEARMLMRGIVSHACAAYAATRPQQAAVTSLMEAPGIRQLAARYRRSPQAMAQYLAGGVARAWPPAGDCGT